MNWRYDDDDDGEEESDIEVDEELATAGEGTRDTKIIEKKRKIWLDHHRKWLLSLHSGYRLRPTRGCSKYLAEHILAENPGHRVFWVFR